MGGSLKGLELVGGRRIIDRVVSAITMVTPDLALSANHSDAATWLEHVAIVEDRTPGLGGFSGIHAGLSLGRDVLAVAWDMPFVTGDLLNSIVAAGIETGSDAVVPQRQPPQGIEPFCAWYSTSSLTTIDAFLQAGGGSARDLVARLQRVHFIPPAALASLGDPRVLFLSVNTAEDLARANAIAEPAQ